MPLDYQTLVASNLILQLILAAALVFAVFLAKKKNFQRHCLVLRLAVTGPDSGYLSADVSSHGPNPGAGPAQWSLSGRGLGAPRPGPGSGTALDLHQPGLSAAFKGPACSQDGHAGGGWLLGGLSYSGIPHLSETVLLSSCLNDLINRAQKDKQA